MTDLCTAADLAKLLRRTLDPDSAGLACALSSSIVRRYCRQELTQTTYTDTLLPIEPVDWSWAVHLPQRPVTAVSAVSVNGTAYVEGTDYAWNGYAPFVRLAKRTWTGDTFQDEPVAKVTYTAGYATVPDEVRAVALAVASREYDNPTGQRTRHLDDFSETKAGSDDDLAAAATLLTVEKLVLNDYRIRAGTVTPR